jgi:hypothetical protein
MTVSLIFFVGQAQLGWQVQYNLIYYHAKPENKFFRFAKFADGD